MYQNRKNVPKSAFFECLNIISLQAGRSTYCMTINGMLLKACFPIGLATSSLADGTQVFRADGTQIFSRRCYADGTRRWYADVSRRWYAELSREGLNQASALFAPDPISISFTSTEICYFSV
jgi:hypothetical protein